MSNKRYVSELKEIICQGPGGVKSARTLSTGKKEPLLIPPFNYMTPCLISYSIAHFDAKIILNKGHKIKVQKFFYWNHWETEK